MSQTRTVDPTTAGARLDKFLQAHLTGVSRTQAQKLIKSGDVRVNGKAVSVHHFLKAGDVIAIGDRGGVDQSTPPATSHQPLPDLRSPAPRSVPPRPTILYEADDLLVLDKPSGLLMHPTERGEPDTLAAWLQQRYPAITGVGERADRGGIVHRLDRDVSGLVVVAKTPAAYRHLKAQFAGRRVRKEYLALVYGHFAQPSGIIQLPIGRSRSGKFVAHPTVKGAPLAADDRDATTRYRVLEVLGPYSLLAVTIDTGRTHQIRAHLAAIGHPIIGDPQYGPRKPFLKFFSRRIKVIATDRIFLHATRLAFTSPQGTPLEYTSSLPAALQQFLHDRR